MTLSKPVPNPANDPQTASPKLLAPAEGDRSDIETAQKRMSPATIQHERQPQTEPTPIEDTRIKTAPQAKPTRP